MTHARFRDWLDPLLVIVALLALWEAASALGWLRPVRFPALSRLAGSLWELIVSGYPEGVTLGTHFAITMQRILGGFVAAVALAVPLGLLIGWFRVLDRLTATIVAFCRSVATLSLLPIALVWFGTGEASKIFLIGYGCFWVMLSNVIAAVKQVVDVSLAGLEAALTAESAAFTMLTDAGTHRDRMTRFLAAGGQTRAAERGPIDPLLRAMRDG